MLLPFTNRLSGKKSGAILELKHAATNNLMKGQLRQLTRADFLHVLVSSCLINSRPIYFNSSMLSLFINRG